MKGKLLIAVRTLEERLKGASPSESGKLTRKLVSLKAKWLSKNG